MMRSAFLDLSDSYVSENRG